jgi:Xaa-Pro aminopeptidase
MPSTDPLHARVDSLMAERKLDALLLTGDTPESPAFWYLTKSQKLEAATLLWKRGGKKLLIVGDMERDNAAKTGLDWIPRSATPFMKLSRAAKKPGDAQLAWLSWVLEKGKAKGRVALYGSGGLESTVSWLPRAKRAFKAAGCELVTEKSPVVARAREIKTEAEIEAIRAAGVGTFAGFEAIRKTLAACHARGKTLHTAKGEPLTIRMLKSASDQAMAAHGLANVHGSIVAQGEEAGVPHNAGTDTRTVKLGLPIVCDIFPKDTSTGYFFDMTRTFCPGTATAAQKKAYEDVRQATVLGFEAYEPGLSFKGLHDRVAHFLGEKGYENLTTHPGTQVGFCHGLGHGLGLEVHEDPFLRAGKAPQEPGMVITIEPGIYYPAKKLGIRIEDVAVVRDGYLENLTDYPTVFEVPLHGKAR